MTTLLNRLLFSGLGGVLWCAGCTTSGLSTQSHSAGSRCRSSDTISPRELNVGRRAVAEGSIVVSNARRANLELLSAKGAILGTNNVGRNPGAMVDLPNGEMAVANGGDGTVSFLKLASEKVVRTVNVSNIPIWLGRLKRGPYLYVLDAALAQNHEGGAPNGLFLVTRDAVSGKIISTIQMPGDFGGVALNQQSSTLLIATTLPDAVLAYALFCLARPCQSGDYRCPSSPMPRPWQVLLAAVCLRPARNPAVSRCWPSTCSHVR